jgi:uncharacterized Zn-binding protein involved in type VI secretion
MNARDQAKPTTARNQLFWIDSLQLERGSKKLLGYDRRKIINGKPAAVQSSSTGCGGSIVIGSSGVFIKPKPMTAVGDATSGCAGK